MSARPLLVVRPEPGNARTLAAARELGLDAHAAPLFAIEPVAWLAPDPAPFDALLLGSANAVRHAGPALARYAALPAYAVGETTAAAARAAGLAVAAGGSGGLQELLPALVADGRSHALRLAGERHVALDPPAGLNIATVAVYAARPLPLPAYAVGLLCDGAVVMLHSGEAARHFAAEADRLGLARGRIALACLGPRIAEAAGSGWEGCGAAARPHRAALLALARELCQNPRQGS